jgi:glycosyltransferase involved in cell wall biosynthesis
VENPIVSIIIPTYKRGRLLNYVLDALTVQTIKDFEVLMVVKPSGDGTEQIIERYSEKLKTKTIIQTHGYVTDALNLGLKNTTGKIIVFLDDDAIPSPNFIQSHILSYSTPNIGGVAGDVIPATLKENKICLFENNPSEIIPISEPDFALKLISRPMKGLENYLICISKGGIASLNYVVADKARHQPVNSLFAKGANMSFLSETFPKFQFPSPWGVLGLGFEQYLGWCLWKKGYRIIFNPEIKVCHIHHGQSLSRNIVDAKKSSVLRTESRLLFYRLYGSESGLSIANKLLLLFIDIFADLKSICVDRDISRLTVLKNRFFGELIGLRLLIYKKLRLNYSPLADLKKMLQ